MSLGGGLFGDTGPGFVFNLGGGPGIRVHQFGGGVPRRRPRRNPDGTTSEPQPNAISILTNLLPLLILFILPLLSSIFSSSGTAPAGPSFRFDTPSPPYTQHRTSNRLKVDYFVNPSEVESLSTRQLRELDKTAEVRYVGQLNIECEAEVDRRRRLVSEAQGWFFVDQDKLAQARAMEMRSCRKLEGLGYLTSNRY